MDYKTQQDFVHCRTGSSENYLWFVQTQLCVHCRTGSSEIFFYYHTQL
ncbi:hypothetical protein PTUN_a1268 [Pseudoalteromonas tunicata]|nr:hypothetical protein PTUN_a1268 [Pseudoalteromonas tunicata]